MTVKKFNLKRNTIRYAGFNKDFPILFVFIHTKHLNSITIKWVKKLNFTVWLENSFTSKSRNREKYKPNICHFDIHKLCITRYTSHIGSFSLSIRLKFEIVNTYLKICSKTYHITDWYINMICES